MKTKNPTFLSNNDKHIIHIFLRDYASREKNMKGHMPISGEDAHRSVWEGC